MKNTKKKSTTSKTNKHNSNHIKKAWKQFTSAPKLMNIIISLFSFIIIFWILSKSHFSGVYHYEVGDIAKENIILPVDVLDSEATEKLVEKKRLEVQPIMYLDFSQLVNSKKELLDFFARLFEIKEAYKDDAQLMKRIYAGIERKNAYDLDENALMALATLPKTRLTTLMNYSVDIISQKMISGITEKQRVESLKDIELYVDNLDLPEMDKIYLNHFIKGSLKENLFVDAVKTEEKIESEVAKIEPVKLKAGTLLIRIGQNIDEKVYKLLKEGDLLIESSSEYSQSLLKIALYLLLVWVVMHAFLYVFDLNTLLYPKRYAMLMSLFVIAFSSSEFFVSISSFSVPVLAYVMLSVMLLSVSTAMGTGVMLVFLLQSLNGFGASLLIGYLLTVILGAVMLKSVKQRTQIITSGIITSLVLVGATYAHAFVQNVPESIDRIDLVYGLTNGLVSAVLTIGILPFYEMLFAALTPFKLLELSNPNKPLLKRLLIEAPGTYHHSILVGNLAETAAHDIKANSLLTRVAAFYHDVGKLDRPFYFKENQISDENPHDKLPPQVSANIIREHMVHGPELCIKNKLPKEIVEVIKAHHGTSLIKYFYHQEQKNNPNVDISRFVYPGPKPKSKEAVILMLADSVEAAVRTLEHPTKDSLKDLIDKIIQQKIEEKQFSDSDMTFRELEKVKKSFVNVLSGIFHERIVYPEIDLKGIQKGAFDETEENK